LIWHIGKPKVQGPGVLCDSRDVRNVSTFALVAIYYSFKAEALMRERGDPCPDCYAAFEALLAGLALAGVDKAAVRAVMLGDGDL